MDFEQSCKEPVEKKRHGDFPHVRLPEGTTSVLPKKTKNHPDSPKNHVPIVESVNIISGIVIPNS